MFAYSTVLKGFASYPTNEIAVRVSSVHPKFTSDFKARDAIFIFTKFTLLI